ncbi:MAG: HlyD family efflux transporter periplasmic adaptor subunit [Thermoguttaceae bacterium]|nr:HlyD family efflux transporter periplasmic adaptor subunit [Thermoguttaceae bacterium]MDW8077870.1 HlyD family efflux transporter periplasmic adaptor subunit [Thermoguttaceae bacterium]
MTKGISTQHLWPHLKRGVWIAGIAAAIALVWFAATSLPKLPEVQTVLVTRGTIRVTITEEGRTRIPTVFTLRMPISGHLGPVNARAGDLVKAGQVLAEIDSRDLDLCCQIASAEVARLEAALEQNRDTTLEKIVWQLATYFCQSMEQAQLAAAKQLEAAKAKAAYAESYLRRMETLFAQKAATEEERDRAQLQYVEFQTEYATSQLYHAMISALKTAVDFTPNLVARYIEERPLEEKRLQAELDAAKGRLRQAELDRSRGKIYAPIDGVVLARHTTGGSYLSAGSPVVDIGRLEGLEVEAEILTQEALFIRPGMPAEVTLGQSGGSETPSLAVTASSAPTLVAKVERVEPAATTKVSSLGVEEERVKVILRPDRDQLKAISQQYSLGTGYWAEVKILVAEKPGAVLVPKNSLWRDELGRWVVWRIVAGRLSAQPIVVGLVGEDMVEATAGVDPGDQIVWLPSPDLRPAQKVRPVLIAAPGP